MSAPIAPEPRNVVVVFGKEYDLDNLTPEEEMELTMYKRDYYRNTIATEAEYKSVVASRERAAAKPENVDEMVHGFNVLPTSRKIDLLSTQAPATVAGLDLTSIQDIKYVAESNQVQFTFKQPEPKPAPIEPAAALTSSTPSKSEIDEMVHGFNILPTEEKMALLKSQAPEVAASLPAGVTDLTYRKDTGDLQFTYSDAKLDEQYLKSVEHYEQIGYPQYGGKYSPFNIPEGMKVSSLVETEGGLNVSFIEDKPPAPLSLTQRLLTGDLPNIGAQIKTALGLGNFWVPQDTARELTAKPRTEFTAGAIASVESPVYSIGGLLGVKNLPEPPITALGGLIGSGIESAMSGKLTASAELKAISESSPAYVAGSFAGEFLQSVIGGAIVSRTYEAIRGVKVNSLVGATEKASSHVTDSAFMATRTTALDIATERVSPKAADYLDEIGRYFTPKKVTLAGSENLVTYSSEGAEAVGRGITSMRNADDYLKAAKYSIDKTPETPWGKLGAKIGIGGAPDPVVTQRVAGILDDAYKGVTPTSTAISQRTFTHAVVTGTIDPQVYISLGKNVPPKIAQSWYKQIGGLAYTQLSKAVSSQAPKTVELVTKVVSVSRPSTGAASVIGAVSPSIAKVASSTAKGEMDQVTVKALNIRSSEGPKIGGFTLTGYSPPPTPKKQALTPQISASTNSPLYRQVALTSPSLPIGLSDAQRGVYVSRTSEDQGGGVFAMPKLDINLSPKIDLGVGLSPAQSPIDIPVSGLTPSTALATSPLLASATATSTTTKTDIGLALTQVTSNKRRKYDSPFDFNFILGRAAKSRSQKTGRQKREYPILTGAQVIKSFLKSGHTTSRRGSKKK